MVRGQVGQYRLLGCFETLKVSSGHGGGPAAVHQPTAKLPAVLLRTLDPHHLSNNGGRPP